MNPSHNWLLFLHKYLSNKVKTLARAKTSDSEILSVSKYRSILTSRHLKFLYYTYSGTQELSFRRYHQVWGAAWCFPKDFQASVSLITKCCWPIYDLFNSTIRLLVCFCFVLFFALVCFFFFWVGFGFLFGLVWFWFLFVCLRFSGNFWFFVCLLACLFPGRSQGFSALQILKIKPNCSQVLTPSWFWELYNLEKVTCHHQSSCSHRQSSAKSSHSLQMGKKMGLKGNTTSPWAAFPQWVELGNELHGSATQFKSEATVLASAQSVLQSKESTDHLYSHPPPLPPPSLTTQNTQTPAISSRPIKK